MRGLQRRRILWVLAAFSLLWLGLGGRLWYWQVLRGPELTRAAVALRMLALPLRPRGQILDRRGQPLSDPQTGWGVAVFPALLTDPTAAAAALAPLTGQPTGELAQRLARAAPRDSFWLPGQFPWSLVKSVAGVGPSGVAVALQAERFGPGALARHLVGYVNRQGGQLGLEAQYEAVLTGRAGPYLAAYLDGRGRPLQGLGIREVQVGDGKAPYDLHLTIDAQVQATVEAVLDTAPPPLPEAPLRAAVVVLDLHSGDVLAMASRPQFDPHLGPPEGSEQWGALLDRTVRQYPPGSVFKPLVAAAALEAGVLTPDAPYFCPGHFDLGGVRFHDASRPEGHGWVTLGEALEKSCNVFFIHVGYELLGRDRLLAAAARFGLGRPTGANLWGEQPGKLPVAQYGGEVAQLAFGQGPEVTPLQLARAYAALASDGRLPPLGLVTRVTGPGGEVMVRPGRVPPEQAVSPQAAQTVAALLARVTDPERDGTGKAAWVAPDGSAGKTGSAQAGGERVHAWFAGWIPRSDPRYTIVVLVEDGGGGGVAAAPLFRQIAERLLAP